MICGVLQRQCCGRVCWWCYWWCSVAHDSTLTCDTQGDSDFKSDLEAPRSRDLEHSRPRDSGLVGVFLCYFGEIHTS